MPVLCASCGEDADFCASGKPVEACADPAEHAHYCVVCLAELPDPADVIELPRFLVNSGLVVPLVPNAQKGRR